MLQATASDMTERLNNSNKRNILAKLHEMFPQKPLKVTTATGLTRLQVCRDQSELWSSAFSQKKKKTE